MSNSTITKEEAARAFRLWQIAGWAAPSDSEDAMVVAKQFSDEEIELFLKIAFAWDDAREKRRFKNV